MSVPFWKIVLFVVATAGVVALSYRSLRTPRYHGVPRFFVWELDIAIVLLNVQWWFTDPFSARQIGSWLLLAGSVAALAAGLVQLGAAGHPGGRAAENTNFTWENTAHLVQTGIYRYIRHPLYASLLMLAWGAWLKDPSPAGTALALAATAACVVTAVVEEHENVRSFGEEYRGYMRRSRRFVPFVF